MSTELRPSNRYSVSWASLLETAQTLTHGFSADRYVRSLVEPWPHDQAGKTIMQHLLWQCLLSTKKAISHLCTQQRGRAQEVLELIYSLLSGWAQFTNTPYVHYVPLNSGSFPALQWNTMCTFLSLKCRQLLTVIPSMLQYMIIENPH